MPGLTIVGASSDAGELRACSAACLALRAAGWNPAPFVPVAVGPAADELALLAAAAECAEDALVAHRLSPGGSPLVASRHAGVGLEGTELLERAARAAGHGEGDVLLTA